jgi:hypothetical protein
MDGAQALGMGGNFYELREWSDEQWRTARERSAAQNAKDRARGQPERLKYLPAGRQDRLSCSPITNQGAKSAFSRLRGIFCLFIQASGRDRPGTATKSAPAP